MNKQFFLLLLLILLSALSYGQLYKLSGIVTDKNKDQLALASVEIKELKKGTISKDDGSFNFFLERGKYTLVVSMMGYQPIVRIVFINNEDVVENVLMEESESSTLGEVVVKAKIRDRAEELIRNVVRSKGVILDAIGSYSFNAYIKAFQLDSGITKKKLDDTLLSNTDFSGMGLTEIALHVDKNTNGEMKEERMGVSKRGKSENLFYLTATDGDFYLYGNLINTPPVSKIPFISPLSNAGLIAYRFKTLSIDRNIKPKVYTIAIRPRQLSNAVIEGEIKIQDSTWNVLSAEYRLPPAHMPEYDYMEVKQQYEKVGDTARMISRQQFIYCTKTKKGKSVCSIFSKARSVSGSLPTTSAIYVLLSFKTISTLDEFSTT